MCPKNKITKSGRIYTRVDISLECMEREGVFILVFSVVLSNYTSHSQKEASFVFLRAFPSLNLVTQVKLWKIGNIVKIFLFFWPAYGINIVVTQF